MPKESNKATLQRAIRQLPVYEPEPALWGSIRRGLEQSQTADELQQSLQQLPSYAPPESVWEGVAAELDTVAGRETGRVLSLSRRLPWAAAAALALLLTGLFWILLPNPEAATVTIVRSEVEIPQTTLTADWNEDEAAFEEVVNDIAEHPLLRNHPQVRNLHRELEELNSAKAEIEAAMENYGRDADLIRQIGRIERERSNVLKRMVALN